MNKFEEAKKEIMATLEPILATEKQPSKLKGRKLEPKYKDPVSGKTWAGRGRLPKWVVGDKEQFSIVYVELTGAAQLYSASPSDQRERG